MIVLFYTFFTLFLLVAILLSLVILAQESKSMGLGASFGGDAGESVFGTSTAFVLKKITVYLATIFIGLCILLSMWSSSLSKSPPAPIPVEQILEEEAGIESEAVDGS